MEIQEDVTKLSYSQLYHMLTANEDIILFLRAVDVDRTKKGISNAKTREASKEIDLGFTKDKERITFKEIKKTPEEEKKYSKDFVKLQVSLIQPANVEVFSVKTINGEEL